MRRGKTQSMQKLLGRVLVGNISIETKEEQIRGVFSDRTEQVLSASMPKHPKTGLSLGYAFVEMSLLDARNAVSELQGRCIGDRKLAISLADAIEKTRRWYQFGFAQ